MTHSALRRVGVAACALILVPIAACSSNTSSTTDTPQAASCIDGGGGTPIAPTNSAATSANIATNPEIATGYRTGMTPVKTATYAVSTANPVSTRAACEVLRDGGTAADALVAAQMVLGLVEPQSSGVGGGAFLLYYDAKSKTVDAYDGRETAPATATEDYLRYVSDTDKTVPKPTARASGRSIGVPGVLRLLQSAHDDHGKDSWNTLFQPAIQLADNGFAISPRMAESISESAADLVMDPNSAGYFLQPDGTGKQAGTMLTNPAMAKTLGAIASSGPDAFYKGDIAQAIVTATADTTGGRTPGQVSLVDLAGYQSKKRTAVCTPYRNHDICGMPGPSSGGIAVASTMGILSNFDMAAVKPTMLDAGAVGKDGGKPTAEGVHLISEAERLAYADRDKYVADPDFIPLPGGSPDALLNPDYLKSRAALINPATSMGTAQAGDFGPVPLGTYQSPEHGTSHMTVADKYGNVATMTTTVESAFGSFHMVDGFVLNNQLTDFSAQPAAADGTPLANRLDPGKRPRSSMAPTLVFDKNSDGTRGGIRLVTGSPGGSVIIQFVVKTLVGILDWGMDPQQAVGMIDFGAMNSPATNVGGEHPNVDASNDGANDPLVQKLRTMGHQVAVADQSSGLSALLRTDSGWTGGADPRREGVVMGDAP